jgi:biopolymer transport protein ExbB
VLGVIKAFRDLSASGAGPEVVMAGLSEALIATAVGLLVALPCVFAFNSLQKRVRDLVGETEALGRRLGSCARAEAKRR